VSRPTSKRLQTREAAVSRREKAVAHRCLVADRREQALAATERAAKERAEAAGRNDAQLREANEQLVVATVVAQALTEVAERAIDEMSYAAEHDFLTGLPNRLLLTDQLSQAIALAKRHHRRGALMYLDLDHFKCINDTLGHLVGDQLLQSTAKRLQACVRETDTVSRQGGDEFVVLLSEISTAGDALQAAEKLILAMAEPHLISGQALQVGVSIGISVFPDDAADVETVVKNADTAMYQARRAVEIALSSTLAQSREWSGW
jgi:diguanylate cyclase (GGDEF)-like protein